LIGPAKREERKNTAEKHHGSIVDPISRRGKGFDRIETLM
jgi:hypothetical protein